MSHPVAEERPVEHGDALNLVRTIIAEAPGPEAAAQRAVEFLHDRFSHYDWVGIYWVEGDELVLGPWIGPEATEHTRIPIGVGICGAAAASGQTEIVDDVNADPRYLACFASTRSEIVVPILAEGRVVGEIDIDGSDPAAFDETDQRFLEEVAALLAPLRPRPGS
ncbi:MAG TPA: GAF domain-containing protein [candidate division Zixibacteria bacterium]|nr:GAF domain-containing protein [candidate division Zixibacteria bacterium]